MNRPGVRVMVLDDGSINRSAAGRLAVYAGQDVTIVGRSPARLAHALSEFGVTARTVIDDDAASRPLSQWDAEIIVVGPPFDNAELADRVQELTHTGTGHLVHVLSPSGNHPKVVVAATRDAVGWARPVAATLRDTWGIPVTATTGLLTDGSVITDTSGDLIIVVTMATVPNDVPAPAPVSTPAVGAADIVHTMLTDDGLVVTNRTPLTVDVRVRLGRMGNVDDDLAQLEFTLPPGRIHTFGKGELGAVEDLPGPMATVRHWSHETETVYEGGQRRINGVDVRYRDVGGVTLAAARYDSQRGLTVGVTGDRIARDLGAAQCSLPRRWAGQRTSTRSLGELLRQIA